MNAHSNVFIVYAMEKQFYYQLCKTLHDRKYYKIKIYNIYIILVNIKININIIFILNLV